MKKEVKVTIIGAIIGAIATSILDLMGKTKFWRTVWSGFVWVWQNIFEFKISIWVAIVALLGLLILKNVLKTKSKNIASINYTQDEFEGVQWRWRWEMTVHGWQVRGLSPVCNKCSTSAHYNDSMGISPKYRCPNCNYQKLNIKDIDDVESVIIDKANRKTFNNND